MQTPLQLSEALRTGSLVRLSRRFERTRIRGYVFDVGPSFFLFALVSDRFWFDGLECFRIADISDVIPDEYAEFAETALRKRGEKLPLRPPVTLTSIEQLIESASRAFPIVTIHREEVAPGVCHIGQVASISNGKLSLLEIAPDAKWDEKPTEYSLDEITRVNFGGDYEEALHLVGGVPAPA